MKDECPRGGSTEVLSPEQQNRAEWRCSCGRWLKLRKNQSGVAAEHAVIPRHKRGDSGDTI